MDEMLVGGFFGYLVAHFALYAAVLRHRRLTETGVFLYHLIPAALWLMMSSALCFVVPSIGPADAVLVCSLHGIYSLTFLELWALADGGYSLAIMDCLESHSDLEEQKVLDKLELLGTAKKQSRLADLVRMGLVEDRLDGYQLTASGRPVAAFIATIAWLVHAPMTS
jgi:hypothetical protein